MHVANKGKQRYVSPCDGKHSVHVLATDFMAPSNKDSIDFQEVQQVLNMCSLNLVSPWQAFIWIYLAWGKKQEMKMFGQQCNHSFQHSVCCLVTFTSNPKIHKMPE